MARRHEVQIRALGAREIRLHQYNHGVGGAQWHHLGTSLNGVLKRRTVKKLGGRVADPATVRVSIWWKPSETTSGQVEVQTMDLVVSADLSRAYKSPRILAAESSAVPGGTIFNWGNFNWPDIFTHAPLPVDFNVPASPRLHPIVRPKRKKGMPPIATTPTLEPSPWSTQAGPTPGSLTGPARVVLSALERAFGRHHDLSEQAQAIADLLVPSGQRYFNRADATAVLRLTLSQPPWSHEVGSEIREDYVRNVILALADAGYFTDAVTPPEVVSISPASGAELNDVINAMVELYPDPAAYSDEIPVEMAEPERTITSAVTTLQPASSTGLPWKKIAVVAGTVAAGVGGYKWWQARQ